MLILRKVYIFFFYWNANFLLKIDQTLKSKGRGTKDTSHIACFAKASSTLFCDRGSHSKAVEVKEKLKSRYLRQFHKSLGQGLQRLEL